MTTIASLRILLGLDAGGVKSGAANVKNDLRGVQAEANRTNATLKNIGAGVQSGLGLGVGLSGILAITKGVSELTGFLADSVQAAVAEEAGIRRLGQALTANIPAFNGNTAAIEATISAREALAFSDDALRDSLAALSGATHDVGRSFELQSLAMDLARFKNIDLVSATSELIKVQAGSFRSLKALGIELKAGASSTEAFAAIQKVVAGQAAAFGETTAGAMTAANIAVHDLQEDIGATLAPAIRDIANFVRKDLIPAFRELGNIVGSLPWDQIGAAFGVAFGPIINAVQGLRDLKSGIDDLGDSTKHIDAGAVAFASYNAAITANEVAFANGAISEDEYRKHAEAIDAAFQGLNVTTAGFTNAAEDLVPQVAAVAGVLNQADDNAAGWTASAIKAAVSAVGLSDAQIAVARATINASQAHADLSEAQKAAGEAAAGDMGAVIDLARAQAADKAATDALKAANDALAASLIAIPPQMLGFSNGADLASDAALRLQNNADTARAALAGLGFVAAETMKIPGLDAEGLTGVKKGEGVSLADSFIAGLQLANQNAAKLAADEAARQATLKGIRDKNTADAKSAADEVARTYHDKLNKAFDDMSDRAHEAYAKLHADNLAAIKDVHDHANALLDEQEKAIRGTVDAERARIQAQRDARTLEGLRANVAGAATPADLEAAKRALGDFLADQRIATLSANADTQIALLEAEKKKNDDVAAAAVTAENARNDAQVKALNKDLANLKDHLKDVVGAWDKAFAEIEAAAKKHHVADIVGVHPVSLVTGSKALAAIPAGINPAVAGVGVAPTINQFTFYLDGIDITDLINIRQAASNSRITSGGIAG